MRRISLDDRLSRVAKDRLSDPDVAAYVLDAVIDVPMCAMIKRTNSIETLAKALGVDTEDTAAMTYGQVVVRVHDLWHGTGVERERALDALYVLIEPFMLERARRKKREANKP